MLWKTGMSKAKREWVWCLSNTKSFILYIFIYFVVHSLVDQQEINPQLLWQHQLVFFKQKWQTFAGSSFSSLRNFCFSLLNVIWMFWGLDCWSNKEQSHLWQRNFYGHALVFSSRLIDNENSSLQPSIFLPYQTYQINYDDFIFLCVCEAK